ncbi:MAG: hypothetical protein VX733_09955 [Candidatus Latescibacterota bacterium]|nr:hypothetical protein [Candidatus Latescibacterota bacterium]
MADKKPGRGGHGAPKKKGKKEPKYVEPSASGRKSNKRERQTDRRRLYEGKPVTPVKYYGSEVGHGNYTAGKVDGVTIQDEQGKPIRFRDFPLEPKAPVDF